MSYILQPPKYDAIQWTGDNVAECEAFFLAWFPQPAPPPPPPAWQPPPVFQYDAEAQTLIVSPGYLVNIGDWLVNGGVWAPLSAWASAPEVVSDVVFGQKYAQTDNSP